MQRLGDELEGAVPSRVPVGDDEPLNRPPVALTPLTALATRRDENRALQAGFDAHLAKPVNWRVREDTLRRPLPPAR